MIELVAVDDDLLRMDSFYGTERYGKITGILDVDDQFGPAMRQDLADSTEGLVFVGDKNLKALPDSFVRHCCLPCAARVLLCIRCNVLLTAAGAVLARRSNRPVAKITARRLFVASTQSCDWGGNASLTRPVFPMGCPRSPVGEASASRGDFQPSGPACAAAARCSPAPRRTRACPGSEPDRPTARPRRARRPGLIQKPY